MDANLIEELTPAKIDLDLIQQQRDAQLKKVYFKANQHFVFKAEECFNY